ncbi:phosphomannomutase/phosphoglucomutase [Patescibacteria group bacterium]|nr:MAG: phosphomannomutase/phosphoglucomutase [Patescibacteria group bacterium]
MRFPAEIFRSYDVRGTVDQLSDELAFAVGAATVRLTGAKRLVVGRDMRPTSPSFAAEVARGAMSEGAEVVDIGMCTTPMFNFAVFNWAEHEAGVMVTASHNPPEYNGFKMTRGNAMPISGEEIREAIEADKALGGQGLSAAAFTPEALSPPVTHLDVKPPYLARLFALAQMPKLNGMKVVVDAGNGMAGVILPDIFSRLDAKLTALYFEPDGTFPNHEANPIKLDTLRDLVATVKREGAAIGVAFDGDADRIGFVDENGEPIGGDQMLGLLASLRLKEHPGKAVVWSPNASWAVRDAIKEHGGRSVSEKVGRTNFIRRVQMERAAIGGEVSAHYFYPEFGGMESSEFTILLVLKALADSGKPMSELIAPYRRYARSPETNFEAREKDKALAALDAKYASEAVSIDRLDGARYEFADWWFNVRKSNTEPLLRVNAEAASKEHLDSRLKEIAGIIENA